MLFSYLAAFFFILIILLAFLLLAPFHLLLNIGKKGPLIEGSIRLAWLGLPLIKAEISPQSTSDLRAFIWKEETGKGEGAVEGRKTNGEEKVGGEKTKEEKEESEIDNQNASGVRSPSIKSLLDAAPALAKILRYLLKSIRVKKLSSRLCFGLNDPAQTAIISGYIWFLASALGLFPASISIEPWFEGERLEGEFMAEIEVRLLWSALAMTQVLRVRETRLLLREMLGWS